MRDDVNTSVKEFRRLATEVAMLMGFERQSLPLEEVDIRNTCVQDYS